MNPRVLIIVAVCAVVAVCAYFFTSSDVGATLGRGQSEKPATGTLQAQPSSGATTKPAKKTGKADWNFLTNLDAGKVRPAPTQEDIARFLAKHGETPANLIAAFEAAHDRRWLDRALELFPNSPLVLMKAVDAADNRSVPKEGEAYQANKERLALIERFKAADPNNPVPWILAAQELFKSKQTDEGVAEIRAALERPAFYIYANERMDAAQRLSESLGVGQLEASASAMFGLTLPHMSAATQASRGLMEWQKSAAESGDTASSSEALRLTYELGHTFATPEASRMLIGQLVGIAMEKRALEALPAGSQPDWLMVTPVERLAEIEQKRANVREVAKGIESVIQSQDGELIAEYLRRMRNESEAAAYDWLKRQKK